MRAVIVAGSKPRPSAVAVSVNEVAGALATIAWALKTCAAADRS